VKNDATYPLARLVYILTFSIVIEIDFVSNQTRLVE